MITIGGWEIEWHWCRGQKWGHSIETCHQFMRTYGAEGDCGHRPFHPGRFCSILIRGPLGILCVGRKWVER